MQVGLRRILMLAAVAGISLFFYVESPLFQRQARWRVIAVLEQATGSRITVTDFHASIWTRQIVMRGVTMRNLIPTDVPYFSAESVLVQLRLSTLFIAERELALLRIQKPRIHVTFDAKGRTNLPLPGLTRPDPRRSPLDPIFNLATRRLEVIDGEWQWDDQAQRMNFDLERVAASLTYDPARDRYKGTLAVHGAGQRGTGQRETGQRETGPQQAGAPLPWSSTATFLLERRALQVTEAAFEMGHTSLKGNLTLRDFRNPAIQAAYQVSLDVAEAGALLHLDALHAGTLTAKGSAKFDTGKAGLRASGEAHLERATLLAFRDLTATAQFETTPDIATFNGLHVTALGGTADGRMRIEHLKRDPRFTIEGHVAGISYTALASTLEELAPDVPVTRVHVMTTIAGDTEIGFGGGASVEVALRGTFSDPGAVLPGYIPLHGRTDMRLSIGRAAGDEHLALRDTVLDTPASHITAEGDGKFHITVATGNQKEFDWLGKLPVTVKTATLDGTLSGPLRALQYDGHAVFDRVVWTLEGRELTCDRFRGTLTASATRVEIRDGHLERANSQILFNAAMPIVQGEVPKDAAVTASAELRDWDAKDLLAWLKQDYPVRGAVRGALTAGGSLNLPSIRGSLEVSQGEAWGERFDSAAANVAWAGHRGEATNVRIVRGRSRVTGTVQYQDDTNAYQFQVTGSNLAIEEIPRLEWDKLKLTGTADLQASGSGMWDEHHIAPTGHATFAIHNATVNKEVTAELNGSIDADGNTAKFQFTAGRQAAHLTASGDVTLREPYAFQARAETISMDLDPLVQPYLGDSITAHSHFDGSAGFQGELRHFGEATGTIEIRKLALGLNGVDVQNDGVWRANYRNHTLTLEALKFASNGATLTVQGSIQMPPVPAASRALNVRADGELDVKLLETLEPGVNASGKTKLRVTLEGTWEAPQLVGRAELEEAQVGSESFPNSLSHLNGTLLFNQTGVRIEKLSGESGGGDLNLSGVLDYTRTPKTFQIRAEARGVRMRYPPGVSTVLDADFNLAGTPQRSQLSGEITVQRAGINSNFDLAEALAQVKQASSAPSELSWARTLQLNVRVVSSNNIRFESGSRSSLDAQFDLRVRGLLSDPALLGHVNILDGKVNFAGTDYNINRGEIQFLNPFRIDPVISLDVTTRKQQYDVSLDFSGPLEKLRVSYRSDPPLPVPDIQLLLVLGRTPSSGGNSVTNPALASVGSNTVLSDTTAATVSGRLGRLFGASPLRIDPQSAGTETNSGTRVSLVQEVAHNVTLTYSTSVTNAQQQLVQMEWTVNRRVSILATRDDNGLFGVDFKFRKQIK
jgi:translocation and assembly module TamB